jgi:hypothetical protein
MCLTGIAPHQHFHSLDNYRFECECGAALDEAVARLR